MSALPKGKPESANGLTRNIIRVINLTQGAVAYRINNAAVYDVAKGVHRAGNIERGLPDIIAIHKGRFIGIEVKSGKDRMSIYQQHRQQEIENAGGVYFIARSTDDFLLFWDGIKKVS